MVREALFQEGANGSNFFSDCGNTNCLTSAIDQFAGSQSGEF
jgi:hypothetical protein